jgi:LCP family protein required for cell wall assembly
VTTPAEPPQGDSAPDAVPGPADAAADPVSGPAGSRDDTTDDSTAEPAAESAAVPIAGADGADSAAEPADPAAGPAVKPAADPTTTAAAADPAGATDPADTTADPAADRGPDPDQAPDPAAALALGPEGPEARRGRRWLRVVAISTAFVVLALAGGVWYAYQQLNGNITTDTVAETELKAQASARPPEGPTKAENILLIGSDNRGDGNEKYGQDTGTQRSDTTILLHLSADGGNATAMSIPRDLMTHVPQCTKPNGDTVDAKFEQFNWAFQAGGAACTIRTVENMTGVRIDHHLIVDFGGFKNMVNAVDGVEVCVADPVHDTQAHLNLPAGKQKLNGEQALGYVRARHSLGDGSDTERIQRQQDFLASLVKKVQSNGVLLNPAKIYPLLNAATNSLTADPGMDSLSDLYKLAQSLQKIPAGSIHFLTVPREQYVQDRNRDQLVQPQADQLFAALRADQPVKVSGEAGKSGSDGSSSSSSSAAGGKATGSPGTTGSASPTTTSTASPTTTQDAPTYQGTTADRNLCGNDR